MPLKSDVLIIGGGIIGSSIAYNLVNDGFDGSVTVLEKDPTYERSSTTLSAGGIRRQFSTEVNIRISQYGVRFYEIFDEAMAVDGEKAHAEFRQSGYLFLANDRNWPVMKRHHDFQRKLGVEVEILNPFRNIKMSPRKFDVDYLESIAPQAAVAIGLALRSLQTQ